LNGEDEERHHYETMEKSIIVQRIAPMPPTDAVAGERLVTPQLDYGFFNEYAWRLDFTSFNDDQHIEK
jgi:hypothetical protein